jgi:DNA-binding response OmpR family regulator
MAQKAPTAPRIVLFGLSGSLGAELQRALALETPAKIYIYSAAPGAHSLNLLKALHPDMIFCAAEPDYFRPLLEAVKQQEMNVPVIVVSRAADTVSWLGALEAGAQDYCAPPFEPSQIRWLLKAAAKLRRVAA